MKHKINEIVTLINELNEVVSSIDINFDNIFENLQLLNNQVAQLRDDTDDLINKVAKNTSDIAINTRDIELLRNVIEQYKLDINLEIKELSDRVDNIVVGQIMLYNPYTGEYQDIQEILNYITQIQKHSYNCTQYDALNLTANVYDSKNVTAYTFDFNSIDVL